MIILACTLDDLAYTAAYAPMVSLSALIVLAGIPMVLNFARWLGHHEIRRRRVRRWLKDPISWTGVVGVTLYLSTVYTSGWIVWKQMNWRLTGDLILWGAVPVCYIGALVFFYVVTSWGAARRDSSPAE